MSRGALAVLLLLAACAPSAEEAGNDLPGLLEVAGDILYAPPASLGEALPPADAADAPFQEAGVEKAPPAWVRTLPRVTPVSMDGPVPQPPVPAIAHYGTLVLRDGCLRLRDSSLAADGAVAVFPADAQLAVSQEGHLLIGRSGDRAQWARVGEALVFGLASGQISQDTRQSIRQACGDGKVAAMALPSSYYDVQRRDAGRNAPRAAEIHGVTTAVARRMMLEELRATEERRRLCIAQTGQACPHAPPRNGERITSWLVVWPPDPSAAARP